MNMATEYKKQLDSWAFANLTERFTVKYGRTFNLGEYESERIDASVDVVVYAQSLKELNAIFDRALTWCKNKVHGFTHQEVEKT